MKPSDYHEALAEIERLNGQLAECYRLSGADPDGNEDSILAPHAVEEVKRLREETDAEVERLQRENAELRKDRGEAIQNWINQQAIVSGLRAKLAAAETALETYTHRDRMIDELFAQEAAIDNATGERSSKGGPE